MDVSKNCIGYETHVYIRKFDQNADNLAIRRLFYCVLFRTFLVGFYSVFELEFSDRLRRFGHFIVLFARTRS